MDEGKKALLAPAEGAYDVLLVAGEHSGDEHAAHVIKELREKDPALRIAAVGGQQMAGAGATLLHDLTDSSVVGLIEVLRHYGYFKRLFDEVIEWVQQRQPRLICLVDYPGFNLRLARALKETGLSRPGGGQTAVYYYISPQIWAWKQHRRFAMAELLDELGVIFPFEVECYADTSLPVHFVGHPFVLYPESRAQVSYDADGPLLLLPGSRVQPVKRILPPMVQTLMRAMDAGIVHRGSVIYPSEAVMGEILSVCGDHPGSRLRMDLVPKGEAVRASAVLTSSGTMSLSVALAGIPGAIIYRANPITYWIGRRVVKIPYLGIANLILGGLDHRPDTREDAPVYPEFIQGEARPGMLTEFLEYLLVDLDREQRARARAEALEEALRAPAESRASDRILALMPQA